MLEGVLDIDSGFYMGFMNNVFIEQILIVLGFHNLKLGMFKLSITY